jgi:hypothetical protein
MKTFPLRLSVLSVLLAAALAGCNKAPAPTATGSGAGDAALTLPPATGKVKDCAKEDDPGDKNCQVEVTLSQAGGGCTVEAIDPDEIRLKKNGNGKTKVRFELKGATAGAAFADPPIRFFELDASGKKNGEINDPRRDLFNWKLKSAGFELNAEKHNGKTYGYSVHVVLKDGAKCERDPKLVNGL